MKIIAKFLRRPIVPEMGELPSVHKPHLLQRQVPLPRNMLFRVCKVGGVPIHFDLLHVVQTYGPDRSVFDHTLIQLFRPGQVVD